MRGSSSRPIGLLAAASLVSAVALGALDASAVGASAARSSPEQAGGISAQCPVLPVGAIDGEIAQAKPGATVIVCPGTYHGDIVVSKPVTLYGVDAVVNASGADNGITVVASGATVQGFTVRNAIGEGILVVGKPGHPVTHVTIRDNVVEGNDQGNPTGSPVSGSRYRACNATQGIPGDCGEGIHLMVAEWSVVTGNTVTGNSGGILLSDEFGPNAHNVVEGNTVTSNLFDCGITVVSHSGAGYVNGATVPDAGGTYDNVIASNTIEGNGLEGQGAGVVLATALPGGAVYDNTVIGNTIWDNGLAGVTLHSHAPGEDLNGNVVERNTIGRNNLDGDPDFAPHLDSATTGVIVASAAGPVAITVERNSIIADTNGIWWTGPVALNGGAGVSSNLFGAVTNEAVQG
jgi:parallel beta-helix repeat protein